MSGNRYVHKVTSRVQLRPRNIEDSLGGREKALRPSKCKSPSDLHYGLRQCVFVVVVGDVVAVVELEPEPWQLICQLLGQNKIDNRHPAQGLCFGS